MLVRPLASVAGPRVPGFPGSRVRGFPGSRVDDESGLTSQLVIGYPVAAEYHGVDGRLPTSLRDGVL